MQNFLYLYLNTTVHCCMYVNKHAHGKIVYLTYQKLQNYIHKYNYMALFLTVLTFKHCSYRT